MSDTQAQAPVATQQAPDDAQQPAVQQPVSVSIPVPEAPVVPQQPVQQPAPEPTPEPKGKDKGEPEVIEYEQTGDPGLDYALSFLGKAGYSDDNPAMQAAINGDFSLLKADLAAKGVQGWEQAVALAERAYETAVAERAERINQVQDAVTQVAEAMGVDWEAAVEFAREHATPQEVETINKLFEDPYTAKMAALWISHAFTNSPNTSAPPARAPVRPDSIPADSAPAGGTITRAEFAQEAQKLHRRFGDSYNQTAEYRALARRLKRN